jgi:hypothetical protein
MKTISLFALTVSVGVVAVVYSSCSSCPPTDTRCNSGVGGGSGGGGGTGGGGALQLYDYYTLDTRFSDRFFMDLVVDQTAGTSRVGIAYVSGRGEIPIIYLPGDAGITTDGGVDGGVYDIRYVEWENGNVKAPEVADQVERMAGISIDYHPSTGQPAIAYLGGGSDMSLYWFNSDAELATRDTTGAWTKAAAATTGYMVTCGNPVSDQMAGVVVGIWPAIKYQSNGTLWYCYRDVHTGQYPQGDWAGADVECVHGSPPNSWTRECTYPGGNTKDAPGGRIRMVMINDLPTILWDHVYGGADTRGNDVEVMSHLPTGGGWTVKYNALRSADTQNGGTIDYDAMTEGLGVAVLDLTDGVLRYTNRAPGATQWSTADPVVGEGTGGWFPSLAMDPINHEPAIAYYACSSRSGQNASQCQPDYDEVRVTQRTNNDWAGHTETVTTDTATMVKLGFLPDGRKVIAYRDKAGAVKVAVRKVP